MIIVTVMIISSQQLCTTIKPVWIPKWVKVIKVRKRLTLDQSQTKQTNYINNTIVCGLSCEKEKIQHSTTLWLAITLVCTAVYIANTSCMLHTDKSRNKISYCDIIFIIKINVGKQQHKWIFLNMDKQILGHKQGDSQDFHKGDAQRLK